MRIILKEDVESLGNIGDIVEVADGYGRNYLVPRGLAEEATTRSMKIFEHKKRLISHKINRVKKDAEKISQQIEHVSCTVRCQAGEGDKIFGSVTTMDIEKSLKAEGLEIDRKRIILDEPIKSLGVYTVPVKVHPEVTAKLKVWVVKE